VTPAPRAIVVLPTFNERDNLPIVIAGLMAHPNVSVLVVDDSSPDGTGRIADELAAAHPGRVEVMHRTERPGLGRSYIDGIRHVAGRPVDVICQMDCDLSHDPTYLPSLVNAAAAGHDLVIGSRYMNGGVSVVNWPIHRILLSAFGNRYIRLVTNLAASDCTSGYRCWRREALARLPIAAMVSDGYAFLVEMLFEAKQRGFRIGEVPIIFIERRLGQSKLSSNVLIESLIMPWRLVFRARS
jgi:dolichol-phosphate mannosyltransferase